MPRQTKTTDNVEERPMGLTTFESRLINLLALLVTQERKQVEQIDALSRAGFGPSEIASLLGTTRNTVSVALSKLKQGRKRSRQT